MRPSFIQVGLRTAAHEGFIYVSVINTLRKIKHIAAVYWSDLGKKGRLKLNRSIYIIERGCNYWFSLYSNG